MASVSDGTYRVSLYGRQFLTGAEPDRPVVLLPDDAEGQVWQIRRTDKGGYTIRQGNADRYLRYEGEPDVFEPVRLLPPTNGNGTSLTGQKKAPSPSPLPAATNH